MTSAACEGLRALPPPTGTSATSTVPKSSICGCEGTKARSPRWATVRPSKSNTYRVLGRPLPACGAARALPGEEAPAYLVLPGALDLPPFALDRRKVVVSGSVVADGDDVGPQLGRGQPDTGVERVGDHRGQTALDHSEAGHAVPGEFQVIDSVGRALYNSPPGSLIAPGTIQRWLALLRPCSADGIRASAVEYPRGRHVLTRTLAGKGRLEPNRDGWRLDLGPTPGYR